MVSELTLDYFECESLLWSDISRRISMYVRAKRAGSNRNWQPTAQGCTVLRGVDCDILESHINYCAVLRGVDCNILESYFNYREESNWDYIYSLHPYLA